jgi:hypothetical protein
MATRRTARSRRTDVEIALDELGFCRTWELMHGRVTVIDAFESEDAMRAVWEAHRDEILDRWRAENPPGTRPFCQWSFEIVPAHGERPTTEHWTAEHERHREAWTSHGILHTHGWPNPLQQPEHEFLYEHGLIDYGEHEEASANWRESRESFDAILKGGV